MLFLRMAGETEASLCTRAYKCKVKANRQDMNAPTGES